MHDVSGDEEQYEVEITKPFYLGVYTVTIGQFAQFVKATGHQTSAESSLYGGHGYSSSEKNIDQGKKYNWRNVGWEQTEDHPVVNVSWKDAEAFCCWLSKKEGKKYRLPTEAEWEYSCRAGTTTRFYSGDSDESLKGVANIADASHRQKYARQTYSNAAGVEWNDGYPFTAPVGKFRPNAFGLYDMHGNVEQWCADTYCDRYPTGKVIDPARGIDGYGERRVFRGGCFYDTPNAVRSASRGTAHWDDYGCWLGFRVAMTISAE